MAVEATLRPPVRTVKTLRDLPEDRSPRPRELPPVLAIHGVGNHAPAEIQGWVEGALERASLSARVREFNWDRFVDHSIRQVRDAVSLLDHTAQSVAATASLPLAAAGGRIPRGLQRFEDGLYSVLHVLVALGLSVLLVAPVLQLLVLLPSSSLAGISWAGFTWLRTGALSLAIVGAGAFSLLFAAGVARSLSARGLRPLLVAARRILLLLLQPLILLVTVPFSADVGGGLVRLVAGMLPMVLVMGVLNVAVHLVTGEAGRTAQEQGLVLAVGAAVGGVGVVHTVLRRAWIGGPLKVVLDIVRYLGTPDYRTKLQAAFDEEIREVRKLEPDAERCRVLLLAHSLGSVIALDSLVNSGVWRSTDEVELVTLGSPIKRFFLRFFPGYLFPGSVRASAELAASRLGRFRWINVHRPWDYVGTRLGFGRDGRGEDLSTGQWGKLLTSHSGYWGDDRVVRVLRQGLASAGAVAAGPRPALARRSYRIPAAVGAPRGSRSLARTVEAAAAVLVLVVLGLAAVRFVQSYRAWGEEIRSDLDGLLAQGRPATAEVTHHRTVEHFDDYSYYYHHFVFEFPAENRIVRVSLPPIEVGGILDEHARRFDYRGLADFVRQDCELLEPRPWWRVWKRRISIPCVRGGIPLLYEPEDPESFLLPDFPPSRTTGDRFRGALSAAFFSGLFLFLCGLVVLGGGIPLFRLFLGLPARR